MKNIKAFTLPELVVTITIIIILSTVWFISYNSYLSDARDTQRKSDFAQIWSALKVHQQQRVTYPIPWNNFELTYNSNIVAYQWKLNSSVVIGTINSLPLDPKLETPYIYSVTNDYWEYQIALTLENDWNNLAYLQWDYKSVSVNILPSIVLALNWTAQTDITTNKNAFVLNEQTQNLVYTFKKPYSPLTTSTSIENLVLSQKEKNLYWQNSDFRTCEEIWEAWKAIPWVTEYQIVNENGTLGNASCTCTSSWCTSN